MKRQKYYFIRKGMAILLAAVLAVGLFLEADSAFAGRVYAEEVKTEEGVPAEQPTVPETPTPEETNRAMSPQMSTKDQAHPTSISSATRRKNWFFRC